MSDTLDLLEQICPGPPLERWRGVFARAFAPEISDAGLAALADALERDDPRLIQGGTTTPPPLLEVQDWPVEEACALGLCAWRGDGLLTVGEVQEYFGRLCAAADELLGEPGGCRWFLHWFDETPREQMRPLLLAEVRAEQARRRQAD